MMDVDTVLADAADQASDNYNDDFDDAEELAEPTVKTSASDILKSSAIEVAYEDAIDAKIASRTHLDKISYERTSSSPTSPSKDALSSLARGVVNEDVKRKKEFQKYDDDDSDSKPKERERKSSSASGESSSRSYNDRADAQNNANYTDYGSDDADGDKDDDDDEGSEENGDAVLNAELLLAVYHGDIKKTNKLLDSGAHYFTRDRHRWTPLMWACSGGHEEILETLLRCVQKRKLKRFVNAKDNITGWTALHVSVAVPCQK